MATLARLLVTVGVKLDGQLKVEQKIKGLRRTTKKLGEVGEQATGRFARGFKKLERTVARGARKIQGAVQNIVRKMGGWRNVMLASGAAAAAAAVGVFKFVDSQTAALDAINKTSATVGVGVEELQRLRFAASQSGVDTGTLDTALKKFNINMLDMANGGGKKATLALERLGLTLNSFDGKTRSEQIGLIGDRLNEVDDAGTRAALAGELLGKNAGPQLATLLAEGTKGIAALSAQATNVFNQDQINAATAFQDRMGEVKAQLAAVASTIALDLLPFVESAVVGFGDWVTTNDKFIGQGMDIVIGSIAKATSWLAETTSNAGKVVDALSSGFDTLTGAIDFGVIPSMGSFTTSIFSAINPVTHLSNALSETVSLLVQLDAVSAKAGKGLSTGAVLQAGRDAMNAARKQAAQNRLDFVFVPNIGPSARFAGSGPAKKPKGGGGGGGKKKKGATAAKKAKPVSGLTVSEAANALLSGRGSALTEQLKGFSSRTPATAAIQPTVAMDIQIFNIEQTITSTEPVAAGRESAKEIRREFKRAASSAAQAITGGTVR
jgi:hypothetical protein